MPTTVVGRAAKVTGRPRARGLAAIVSRALTDNYAEVALAAGARCVCEEFHRGDLGVTLNGANVSAWGDQSKLGRHLAQGAAGSQPPLTANAQNGYPSVDCDGVADFLTVAFAQGAQFTLFLAVKNITIGAAAAHDWLVDGGVLGRTILLQDSAPLFTMTAGIGVTSPTRQADGFYDFWTAQFNGATSFFRAHGNQILTGNTGGNSSGGLSIGASQSGLRPANVGFLQAVNWTGAPSAAAIRRLEAMAENRFAL